MKKILLLIFLVILWSCNRKNIKIGNSIDLLSKPESLITNLSDIASDVEYIPLQTFDKSLIRNIYYFKTIKDKIYISTLTELISFDSTGRYINKLSKVGRGPGEYKYLGYFDINSTADFLIFQSNLNILVYKIKGNDFIYYKSLNIRSDNYNQIANIDFIPGHNNILLSYLCCGNEHFRYSLINLDGDTLTFKSNFYKFTNNTKKSFYMPIENISYYYNNSLHFKNWYSDTVFTFNQDNKIIPYLILNSNGKQITPSVVADLSSMNPFSSGGFDISPYLRLNFIMEVTRDIIYSYSYMKKVHYEIYDKTLNKKFGITIDSKDQPAKWLKDDIIGGVDFEPKYCFDRKLYSWIDAMALKKHISEDNFKKSVVKNPEKKKALENLAASLNDTDNPVLIVVTFKK